MMSSKPSLISFTNVSDKRGTVFFNNQFNFQKIKRFYIVKNSKEKKIRAFHGHFKEEKFVYAVSGKILLCVVRIDNKTNPSKKVKLYKFVLDGDNPKIIHIPAGFANGFKALKQNSKVIFFSTSSLKDSLKDDFRFPYDYWGKDVWKTNGL